jgi:hypothetical protein
MRVKGKATDGKREKMRVKMKLEKASDLQ